MSDLATDNRTKGSQLAPDNNVSVFRIYALGTVAADFSNKSLEEDPNQTLEVFLDEMMSGADGKVEAAGSVKEVSATDAQGNSYTAKAATTTSVQCYWLPFGSNRMTAPNLRKGQRVVVWRTADEEQLYWQPKGGDSELMTMESVILTVSARPSAKKDRKSISTEDCYYLMVDTFLKKAVIGTSAQLGEVTQVYMELNLDEGYLQVADSVHQNLLLLHFVEHMLRYQNQDDSIIDVTKKNITFQCEDTLKAIAKNDIRMKAKNIYTECENFERTSKTESVTSQNVSLKCDRYTTQVSGQTTFKCPNTVFTGAVSFTGEDGNTMTLNGNFIHIAGSWRSPTGTNVYTHDHGGVDRGSGRTDPFQ